MEEKVFLNTNEVKPDKETTPGSPVNKLPPDIIDLKYSIDPVKRKRFDDFVKRENEKASAGGVEALRYAESGRERARSLVESRERSLEESIKKIGTLRKEISLKKSSIITRVLEFKKIRELQRHLNLAEDGASVTKESLDSQKELAQAYEYMIAEEQKLVAAVEEVKRQTGEAEEGKRLEFLEDEASRGVGNLVKKHSVFFVHDLVDADWKPSENNEVIDTKNLRFNDQLDIVSGLDPTISVSTLKPDTKQRTFGKRSRGLFLSGGRVVGGEPSDAGTKAHGLQDRRIDDSKKTVEAIDSAINARGNAYNELVVENPEVAGVYVKWGTGEDGYPELSYSHGDEIVLSKINSQGKDIYDNWWKGFGDLLKRNMPIFILDADNSVYMMHHIDLKKKSFEISGKITPEQMADLPGIYKQHLNEDDKRKAVMRVFNKVTGLLQQDKIDEYMPDGTEGDVRDGLYSIH